LRVRSLKVSVLGWFSAATLLVGAIFVLLLVSVVTLRGDDRSSRRSSDLLSQSFSVELSVLNLETGLRGFQLTHRARFLRPYLQAQSTLPKQLRTLAGFARTADQRRAVNQITGAVNRYIADYAKPLIATGGRPPPGQEIAGTTRGKQLLDALRGQFQAFDAGALALRAKQRAGANAGTSTAILIGALGLGASVLLLLGLPGYCLRAILRPIRTVAIAAARLAGGDLGTRVPQVGRGEIAVLARSFNEMAAALSESREKMRRAIKTAEAASAMKSNFVANMSHEIRTPLNGVVGMITLLGETGLSAEQSEYIDAARASSEALLTVVNDILDIAKIEAGRLAIERRDFDLYDMVEASCDMLAASALAKGLQVQTFVHDDVPRAVSGDRMRVSQILANLASNAIKFTAEGEVIVEATVAARNDATITVRFEVRDTGIGIAPDRIGPLFEPFTQADVGTTREFGGTGLGLAISRQLTHLMGGTIECESEPGHGSTFRVEIPFAPAQAELLAPVPADELHGLRVLVLDDNATNRRIFEAYVASWGMRVDVAANAAEAFACLEQAAQEGDPFDIALLDFNLPEESGLDLARRITAAHHLRHTRLIMLTSSGQPSSAGPADGIRCHLTKPVRQARLLDAIGEAMASDSLVSAALNRPPRRRGPRLHGPFRVLVAEDQPINWMVIERLLTNRGHLAANAIDGRRALAMLAADHYDLIFMDSRMPLLDGYDTTREIRRLEAAEHRGAIPIVAMTANAMVGAREECLKAGMDDYMTKPVSRARIDEMLAHWLPDSTAEPAEPAVKS
jgi:signal transduction histidine kinase/DNA-binding response OmpR family regulator